MGVPVVTAQNWNVEVLQPAKPVLVDFYADWCYPCRALAPVLEQLAADRSDDLKVVKLDTDRDEELSEQYGVRTIPTLILFRGGEEVGRVVNPRVRARIEELLNQPVSG